MLDLVLTGGTVYDGRGGQPFSTDVAFKNDRIARVGACTELDALERIDCTGLCVAPGFIDMHGHSDELLLILPTADSKIHQGITTEVGGNCGFGPAPLLGPALEERRSALKRRWDLEVSWTDFDGFFDRLAGAQPALNFCCLAGLGTIRSCIGATAPAALDSQQLVQAQRLVAQACEQGAIGVSSGLIYPPGSFADTGELVALASAAARSGAALYATHLRSEGRQLVEAVDEALAIGWQAQTSVQLSHHKASGRANWGRVHDTLARIDRARNWGLDAMVDQYPYKASSTGLDVILPNDVRVGSNDEIAARLQDPRYAAVVAARVELEYGRRWHEIFVSTVASQQYRPYEGLSLWELGKAMGQSPVAAALRLLADERLEVSAIYFTMCESDVRSVLSYQHTCIGSDASVRATAGVTSQGKPHPRAYGTFPRIFRRYVKDTGLLELGEAVRRATSLPAARLNLRERGLIQAGYWADVVVFDAAQIADAATYLEPHRYATGVLHLIVNGQPVLKDGHMTGLRPGRVLRRGRDL